MKMTIRSFVYARYRYSLKEEKEVVKEKFLAQILKGNSLRQFVWKATANTLACPRTLPLE